MRLNQFIAKCGLTSRRKAVELVRLQKVTVNQQQILNPYYLLQKGDIVKINDKQIGPAQNISLLINKPKGVTTTCRDRFAKKTILDLLPKKVTSGKKRIYPVGRLDKNSCGLVILTNNGEFCQRLLHPKFEIEKEYLVCLSEKIKKCDLKKAKSGILDQGELLKVKRIVLKKSNPKEDSASKLKVILSEGKKRHLRRLFNRLGYQVTELKRVRIADFKLGNLKEKEFKIISHARLKKYLK